MALRMEKAFGIKMDTLMRMQSSFDIAQIRKRSKEIHLQRISRLTEDQQDILISRARRNERSVPLKQVKANLIQRGRLSA
jgi:plasmid maintenance system antidote protein VapI